MADGIITPCNMAWSWHWFRQVTAPCNVAGGSEITCHGIRANVRHIGILHLVLISTISPQSTCHSAPVCEILSKSVHPQQKKMTSCWFSRWWISAILDFRGPIMGSLKSRCTTSYRSSIETIALNCLVFEKIAFLHFGHRQTVRQTNRWTAPMHWATLAVASSGLIITSSMFCETRISLLKLWCELLPWNCTIKCGVVAKERRPPYAMLMLILNFFVIWSCDWHVNLLLCTICHWTNRVYSVWQTVYIKTNFDWSVTEKETLEETCIHVVNVRNVSYLGVFCVAQVCTSA